MPPCWNATKKFYKYLKVPTFDLPAKSLLQSLNFVKDAPETAHTKGWHVCYRSSTPLLGNVRFWKNEKSERDVENDAGREEQGENQKDLLVRTICPFVREFPQARHLSPFPWTLLSQKPRATDNEQATEENGRTRAEILQVRSRGVVLTTSHEVFELLHGHIELGVQFV